MEQITSHGKIRLLLYVLLFFTSNYKCQNLIKNPSFEERGNKGLKFLLNKKICKNWYNASKATPDYFRINSNTFYNVPNNMWGNQEPKSGNSYVGVDVNYNDFEYEYLQTKLTYPLKANSIYCLSFYISLADKFDLAINEFQFALTQKSINHTNKEIFKYDEINYITSTSFFSDKENWVKLTTIYKAKGNENYLTLGIFNDKYNYKNVAKKNSKNKFKGSYYYIDDVSLVEIKDSSECKCSESIIVKKDSVKVKVDTVKSVSQYDEALTSSIILKDINFETDKSDLLQSSYKELDKLVNYLKQNPSFKIEITGYTDNTGKENDNLKLSEERAKTVVNYLIQNGIDEKRTSYNGYGSENPIVPNDSEENKAKNRRVEFKLIKE